MQCSTTHTHHHTETDLLTTAIDHCASGHGPDGQLHGKSSHIVLSVVRNDDKLHVRSIYQFKNEQPASSSAHRPLGVPTGGLASQQRCAACDHACSTSCRRQAGCEFVQR